MKSKDVENRADKCFQLAKKNYNNTELRMLFNKSGLALRQHQKKLENIEYSSNKELNSECTHEEIKFIESCFECEIYKCIKCGYITCKISCETSI
ncbi:MAG: hypothetical protein RSG52_15140 [Terrisporobacter sp.]|uniref:hypothetical protein n=1 Tax=Terrisporobacter sp. TaxID=1965305 RepID=UPI002FCB4C45